MWMCWTMVTFSVQCSLTSLKHVGAFYKDSDINIGAQRFEHWSLL
jgi:hypothetical protein